MAVTSVTTTNILFIASAFIFLPKLVLGYQSDDYPKICDDQILTLTSVRDHLPKNFIVSPSLKCISIINTDLNFLEDGAFDKVPNLLYVDLSGNSIPSTNLFSFGNVSTLRALILSNQTANHYSPNQLIINNVYPELQYLSLKRNGITYIETNTNSPFPNLTDLDLSENQLTEFDPARLRTRKLTHLNLNGNQISRMSFVELKDIVSLSLDNNKIVNIGGIDEARSLDLTGLSKLEHLSIANNHVDYVGTAAFNDTINLRYLNMSGNLLSMLNTEIFAPLSTLEVLVLDDNALDTIPMDLPNKITTLSMKCNKITVLTPHSLLSLPNLKKLILSGNRISNVYQVTFNSQSLLEELYLNDNELSYLPERWDENMEKLRLLDLSGNQFTSIHRAMSSIQKSWIYLDDNPIEYIGTDMLPQNVQVYLNVGKKRFRNYCPVDRKNYDDGSEITNRSRFKFSRF